MTKIMKVNPINPEKKVIEEAACIIKSGGIVAFPTETVYGIGANAFDNEASLKIFAIKNRPADNPLIVHISSMKELDEVAEGFDSSFVANAKILWPGPITFILKKNSRIPEAVSAGLGTVAVRMPAHPVALELIKQSGVPIAAPSANLSKKPSPTKAEHVITDLDGKVDAILDGGEVAFGIESTIINATVKPYMLLRPGAYTIEELEKYLGKIEIPQSINKQLKESEKAIAPGMKYRHYAPDKKLIIVSKKELIEEALDSFSNRKIAVLCSNELAVNINSNAKIIKLGSEKNLYEIAKNLFDSFRKLDRLDVEFGFIQSFPERGIGFAIMNRMAKASGLEAADSISDIKSMIG